LLGLLIIAGVVFVDSANTSGTIEHLALLGTSEVQEKKLVLKSSEDSEGMCWLTAPADAQFVGDVTVKFDVNFKNPANRAAGKIVG
jgi:hypothetical protein